VTYALFAVSGFAALVYETVWTRRLVLVLGATVYSASTVLAGFMAGFALGALLGARLSRKALSPLRLYGWLELGIAAAAALFPLCIPLMLEVMERTALPIGPLRFAMSFASVLPATVLMGATFPVLCGARSGEAAGTRIAGLYTANLLGACAGVLVNAFLLLAFLGLAWSHWLAVALNCVVGVTALFLSRDAAVPEPEPPAAASGSVGWTALAVGVSGFCGMAFEVVWFRLLLPSFNNSAYGFATVLFVFLFSLGIGSWLARRVRPGLALLGGLQGLSALLGFVGYAGFELTQVLQSRFADMANSGISPFLFIPFAEALVLLTPLAVVQGMIFPTAARLDAAGEGAGAAVGRLYFWNTLGAILGTLTAGFWWIPAFNVQNALLLILGAALACGAVLIAAAGPRSLRWAAPAAAAALLALAWGRLRGRYLPSAMMEEWGTHFADLAPELLSYTEDLEGSVAVEQRGGGRRLVINGVGVAGYTNITKLLAHIPLALHPRPERALIICFGLGTTFRSALSHEGVRVDVVELAGAVLKAFPLFYRDAERWTGDPRARLIVNDGRNHLLRDREGYDVILADPSPPLYSAGTVNLYSRDFFALALRKLKPGGLLAVWLPEYPEPEFNMVLKSFFAAVPHAQLWLGSAGGGGVVMLGSAAPIPLDQARVSRRLAAAGVRRDLLERDGEFRDEAAFWKLALGPARDFAGALAAAPEVTDEFPRIEYPYFRAKTKAYYRHPAILAKP